LVATVSFTLLVAGKPGTGKRLMEGLKLVNVSEFGTTTVTLVVLFAKTTGGAAPVSPADVVTDEANPAGSGTSVEFVNPVIAIDTGVPAAVEAQPESET
jgi:hypothetical protein